VADKQLRIVHFSDYHLHNNSRQKEFAIVFNNFLDKCKEIQPDYIIFPGDWNHENTMLSTESIVFTKWAFKQLSDICPVIVSRGNHDSALNNNDKITTLESILTDFTDTVHPIYAFYHSAWQEFPEFDLGVFDYMDTPEIFQELADKPKSDKISIAMYHGIVGQARVSKENEIKLKNSHLNMMPYFSNYSFTMLGDIHQMQYLNEDKTIAYSGSMLQNNFNDSMDKGFLLWEINSDQTFSVQFIAVENPYKRIEVELNDLDQILSYIREKNPTKKSSVKVKLVNVPLPDEQKIIQAISTEFGIKPGIVNTKQKVSTEDLQLSDSNKDSFYDVDYQNKMLTEYANLNEIKVPIEDIVEMNTRFNQQLKFEYGFVNWTINRLEFQNLFKYGGDNINKIDFSQIYGIVGIPGNSAIGKSSIVYIISWLLFDKCNLYDIAISDILNSKSKEGYGEIEFTIDGRTFVIKKDLKRSGKTVKSTMMFTQIMEDGTRKNENEDNSNQTKAKIQKLIGTYDDFITTNLSLQGKSANFIESNNSEKKRIVAHFVGLKIFDDLAAIADKHYKELGERIFGPTDVDYYASQIVQLKQMIFSAEEGKSEMLSDIESLEKSIEEYKQYLEDEQKNLKPLLLNPNFNKDVANQKKERLEKEIADIVEKSLLLTGQRKELYCESGVYPTEQELRNQFKPLLLASDFNKEKSDAERTRLQQENNSISEQIEINNSKIVEVEKTEETYRQELKTKEEKVRVNSETLNKIELKLSQLKSKIDDVNSLLSKSVDGQITKHDVCDNCGLYSWFSKNQSEVGEHQSNIEYLNESKQKLLDENKTLNEEISVIRKSLNTISENKTHQFNIDRLNNTKQSNQMKLEKIERDLNLDKDNTEIVKHNAVIQERLDIFAHNNEIDNQQRELQNEHKSKGIELTNIESDLNKYADNEKIVELNKETNEKISQYKSTISEKQSKVAELRGTLKANETIIESNQKQIHNYEIKIKELEEFQKKYELIDAYKELIKSDGLPEFVLEKKLEPLIDEINSLLTLTDYQINIILEKEGRKTQKINITYKEGDNDWMSINLASGAERATLSLIFRIAMLKMSCLGHCSTLFIDELFSPLDADRLESVEDMLQIIKDYFTHIISISHIESIKRCVDNTINIANNGMYSYVVED